MESPQRDPRVGVVLNGRYRITELLGEGGMGLVYRGERLQLGRPVAIKFLHGPYAKSPKYMARFEREARAMSKLSHPYCVSVIDFGVHEEPYIVMDFVTGETLRELLDRERLAPVRTLQITRQLLAGLAHAHGQGVIHRDIKPGNIMVGEATGMGDHVRLFDFGLAKLHGPEAATDQSMATVIGTPAYMSPEQTRAEPIDGRADLYAVGVLLFEMLVGEKPFIAEDAYGVIRMQRDEPPPLLRARAPALSSELEQVVAKALEKRPEDRYQTAAEFAAALELVPEASNRASYVAGEALALAAREQDAQASAASSRSTKLAIFGLVLVSAVGSFAYFTNRPPSRQLPARRTSGTPDAPAAIVAVASEPPPAFAPEQDAGEPDDAALALDALAEPVDAALGWEDALAEADRQLSVSDEQELPGLPSEVPEVHSISDVHDLIDRGQLDAAIVALRSLRQKSPLNPYLPYLLGDLYFERGFWGDGLAKYREAIRLSEGYKKRATIHENAVRALANDQTYARAAVLLLRDVGSAAAETLAQAAQRDASDSAQMRAAQVAAQLPR
jgi:eukaryotic-like serine/threonine-protein kinase